MGELYLYIALSYNYVIKKKFTLDINQGSYKLLPFICCIDFCDIKIPMFLFGMYVVDVVSSILPNMDMQSGQGNDQDQINDQSTAEIHL